MFSNKNKNESIEKLTLANEQQLLEKINDLKNIDVNTFAQKFKNLINEYIRPNYLDPYVYSTNKNFLLSNNINEDRIKKYIIFKNLFVNLNIKYPLPNDSFLVVYFPESKNEIVQFWRSVTIKVYNKKVLGFPMCIYSAYNNSYKTLIGPPQIEGTNLFFFKHQNILTSTLFQKILVNIDEFIFQKCLIFYTLYNYGISSDNYIFDEIPLLSQSMYTFKIKDLIFNIPITKIIVLSPLTSLVAQKINVMDYINTLENIEQDSFKYKDYTTFYDFFIENFYIYFVKYIYNTRNIKTILELSTETKHLIPGNIYILVQDKLSIPVYIIILSENNSHIKYLVLFDSTINKTFTMKIHIKQKIDESMIFYHPDFLFEKNLFEYCIG